jgi:hypothetical protein
MSYCQISYQGKQKNHSTLYNLALHLVLIINNDKYIYNHAFACNHGTNGRLKINYVYEINIKKK